MPSPVPERAIESRPLVTHARGRRVTGPGIGLGRSVVPEYLVDVAHPEISPIPSSMLTLPAVSPPPFARKTTGTV